jgi:hypothetical protein
MCAEGSPTPEHEPLGIGIGWSWIIELGSSWITEQKCIAAPAKLVYLNELCFLRVPRYTRKI